MQALLTVSLVGSVGGAHSKEGPGGSRELLQFDNINPAWPFESLKFTTKTLAFNRNDPSKTTLATSTGGKVEFRGMVGARAVQSSDPT